MALEKYLIPENGETPKLAVHLITSVLSEYIVGTKNEAEIKTAIENSLGLSLNPDESQDLTDIIAYIDLESDPVKKRAKLNEIYKVWLLAELGVWYGSHEALRTRMNWADPSESPSVSPSESFSESFSESSSESPSEEPG